MTESDNINDFLSYMRCITERYNIAVENESIATDATQDILHRLELHDDTYHARAKLANRLSDIRKARRESKDEMELLEPVIAWIEDNSRFIDSLNALLGDVRRVERKHANRAYLNRTDVIDDIISTEAK